MRSGKKTTAIIVLIALVISAIPCNVSFAEQEPYEIDIAADNNLLGEDNYGDAVYLITVPKGTTQVQFVCTSDNDIQAIHDFYYLNEITSQPIDLKSDYIVTLEGLQEYVSDYGFENIFGSLPEDTYYGFSIDDKNGTYPYYLINVEKETAYDPVDKTELISLLNDISSVNYYTTDDRYNGNEISDNGFWSDIQSIISEAEAILNNENATQAQVDAIVAKLLTAKDKLIPINRVNPTALYEEIARNFMWFNGELKESDPRDNGRYDISEADTTAATLQAYINAKAAGQNLLDSLYTNGVPNETNTADRQSELDEATAAILLAVSELDRFASDNDLKNAEMAYDSLDRLANKLFAPLLMDEDAYTAESGSSFISARDQAIAFKNSTPKPEAGIGHKEAQRVIDAYIAFWKACYEELVPASTGNATLTVTDNYSLFKGSSVSVYAGSYSVDVPANGVTIGSALTDALGTGYSFPAATDLAVGIYVNGIYVFNFEQNSAANTYIGSMGYENILLKPGDEVTVAIMLVPTYVNAGGATLPYTAEEAMSDIRYLRVTEEKADVAVLELESGESVTISADYMLALVNGYTGYRAALEGASAYLSDAYTSREDAEKTFGTNDSGVFTAADGSITLTLYSAENSSEGWYRLNIVDNGERGGLSNGPGILIHVSDPDDLSALREEKLSALEEIYEAYDDSFYTAEQLETIKNAYDAGIAGINAAQNSSAIEQAYEEAAEIIKAIQQQNTEDLVVKQTYVHELLAMLPTLSDLSAGRLYSTDQKALDMLLGDSGVYTGMTEYQRNQLTVTEQNQINALIEAYEASGKGQSLPELPEYSVTIRAVDISTGEEVEGGVWFRAWEYVDWSAMELINGDNGVFIAPMKAPIATFSGDEKPTSIAMQTEFPYNALFYFSCKEGYSFVRDSTGHELWEANVDDAYSVTLQRVTGRNWTGYCPFFTFRENGVITVYVSQDSTAPADDLAEQKALAQAALEEAYNAYMQEAHSDAEKAALEEAKNNGLAAIDAAADKAAVQAAYEDAIVAMKTIVAGNWVRVIVENTTYLEADGAPWDGKLVDTTVDIGSASSMMAAVEQAVALAGKTLDSDGSYISAINGLAQLQGGTGSGWMGSLNGWLVNESFASITVADRKLKAGDEILIQYTCDFGQDIGGAVEGDTNTTLKELVIENAVITPEFDGSVTNYTLTVTDPSKPVTVTYTPANKAYQARAYLNNYDPNADFWYESGSVVPVAPGDVIYIGVGESAWPSMGSGARTRYVITALTGVDSVIDQINTLPSPSRLTVDDRAEVERVQALYEALSDEDKAKVPDYCKDKLDACVERIEDLLAAKDLEDRIEAMPDPEDLTYADVADVRKAQREYEALSDGAKDAMKVSSIEKLEALIEAAEKLAEDKEGAAEDIYKTTGDYLVNIAKEYGLTVSQTGGDWIVVGLERAGRDTPGRRDYLENAKEFVNANADENERLDRSKSTENSRLILALTALGEDVTNVDGHNLLKGLDSMDYLKIQGINGPIWALIALDSHDYELPETADYTRYELVNYILDQQFDDGGWALSGSKLDADITGMAIQALAPYYDTNAAVKEAVDRALAALSSVQNENGGFGSIDGASVESCAQVVVALTSLGIDPMTDDRFIKNEMSVIDALCSFYVEGGGFRHIASGSLDGMATEQGFYALASWFRLRDGKTSLYDMTDVEITKTADSVSKMIEDLPTPEDVTLDDEDAIEEARDAYESLSDEEKAKVPEELVKKLESDEEKLSEQKAKKAEDLIKAIPEPVKLSDEETIKAAREYFDSLTDEEKAMVDPVLVSKLEKAEKDLKALKDGQNQGSGASGSGSTTVVVPTDKTKYEVSDATKEANEVMKEIIDKTPETKTEFTEEEVKEIVDAYKKYEALSADEKLFATNYKDFESKVLKKLGDDLHYDEPTGTDARNNPEKILPWHVKLNVGDAKFTDEQMAIIKEVLGEDANLDEIYAVSYTDILTGKDYEPSDQTRIAVPMPSGKDGKTFAFVTLAKDGSFKYLEGKVSGKNVEFKLDGSGPFSLFDSSRTWEEIVRGKEEPAKKNFAWLYAAGGAGLLLILILLLKRRKKDEDE